MGDHGISPAVRAKNTLNSGRNHVVTIYFAHQDYKND